MILTIEAMLPAKYEGYEIAVKANVIDAISRIINAPFEFSYTNSMVIPNDLSVAVKFSGNTRRIGPVTQNKIRCAVRQGLAVTRYNCGISR